MDLPKKIIQVLRPFEEVFSERVWEWAKVLLIGAILAKGRTNGDGNFTRDGAEPGTAVSELSSRARVEPNGRVEHSVASYCICWCEPLCLAVPRLSLALMRQLNGVGVRKSPRKESIAIPFVRVKSFLSKRVA